MKAETILKRLVKNGVHEAMGAKIVREHDARYTRSSYQAIEAADGWIYQLRNSDHANVGGGFSRRPNLINTRGRAAARREALALGASNAVCTFANSIAGQGTQTWWGAIAAVMGR